MMSGMGSNNVMMQKMMRGMLSGMAAMMKHVSEDGEATESCCGGIAAGEGGGELANLAKQCRPLLEKMKELIPE